jgi:predicted Fe-Mo cluster-binding NifX family protein
MKAKSLFVMVIFGCGAAVPLALAREGFGQPQGVARQPAEPKVVAVTAVKASLDADVDPRFGRCAFFVIADLENGTVETIKNVNANSKGHVGPLAVKLIASKGVKVLLTGKCGPTAFSALSKKKIRVVEGCSGSVRDVMEQFKEGKLKRE